MFKRQYTFKCLTGKRYTVSELFVLAHYIKPAEPHTETLVPYIHDVCSYNNLIDTVIAVPVENLYRHDDGFDVPVTPVLRIVLIYSIIIAFLLHLGKQRYARILPSQQNPLIYGYFPGVFIKGGK